MKDHLLRAENFPPCCKKLLTISDSGFGIFNGQEENRYGHTN